MKEFSFNDFKKNLTFSFNLPEEREKLIPTIKIKDNTNNLNSTERLKTFIINCKLTNEESWGKKSEYEIKQEQDDTVIIQGDLYEALNMLCTREIISVKTKQEMLQKQEFISFIESTKGYKIKSNISSQLFSSFFQREKENLKKVKQKTVL